MFKGQSGWNTLLGIFLTVVLIGGAIWIFSSEHQVAADYQDIRELYSSSVTSSTIDLSLGLGELVLSNAPNDGVLIEGNITPDEKKVILTESESKLSYRLENNTPSFYPHTARWELGLADDIDLDLIVNIGVGEVFLSLEQLELESLDANQGVGRLVIRLPRTSPNEILIKQAVGSIQMIIPDGVKVTVDAQNGLTKVNYPPDFELEYGYYVSPGASRSNADLNVVIEQAIGLVNIQYTR
jgi:hypothetical protein